MPKVDFYLIPEISLESGLGFICRLLDKAYQQKNQVYVQLENETLAKTLDDLLWTFRDDAFIPHGFVNETFKVNPPVLLSYQQQPAKNHTDILLNLTQNILPFYTQFKRVIEIVPSEGKTIGRKKFKHYKNENYEPATHDLQKTPPGNVA